MQQRLTNCAVAVTFGLALVISACSDEPLPMSSAVQSLSTTEGRIRLLWGSTSTNYHTKAAFSLNYPRLGKSADFGIFIHKQQGTPLKIAYDSDGYPTSAPEMQLREFEAIRKEQGSLGNRLFATLQTKAAAQNYRVIIGYQIPVEEKPAIAWNRNVTYKQVIAASQARLKLREQKIAGIRSSVLSKLVGLGAIIHKAHYSHPVIEATLSNTTLNSFLDSTYSKDIVSIEIPAPKSTIRSQGGSNEFFWASDDLEAKETFVDQGKEADGIRVGILEGDVACTLWHPGLFNHFFGDWSGYVEQDSYWSYQICAGLGKSDGDPCGNQGWCSPGSLGYCMLGRCVGQHPSAVASNIGCRPGVSSSSNRLANKAHIYYANYSVQHGRWLWLAQNNVQVANNSEEVTATDAANWVVRNDFMTITSSAGNETDASTESCDCFANAICVGAARVNDPFTDIDNWKTDPEDSTNTYEYAPGFHYLNGFQTRLIPDVEKPDVLAMDQSPVIDAKNHWFQFDPGGTSYSAPKIAGLVALLQEQQPWTAMWPEAVRAIVMTSAVSHNVEGAQLSSNDTGDQQDGAGVPVASNLSKIDTEVGAFLPSMFTNGWYTGPDITLQPGEGVRVVLGWTHCSPSAGAEDNKEYLAADLDLYLKEGSTTRAFSLSYNNSLEFVEYTNNTGSSKTVTVKIKQWGAWKECLGLQREYYGLAWVKHVNYLVP